MKNIGCYIILSQKINKFYIGVTQKSLTSRIQKHKRLKTKKKTFKPQDYNFLHLLFKLLLHRMLKER